MDAIPERLIEASGLSLSIGKRTLFSGLSFHLDPGEVVGVTGGVGSGKSSLFKVCATLIPPSGGTIRVLGEDLKAVEGERLLGLRRGIGVVFQDAPMIANMSVYENIALPLLYHTTMKGAAVEDRVLEICRVVGLSKDLTVRPAALPPGERKRANLSRALIMSPPLLLWDDLIPGRDVDSTESFHNIVNRDRMKRGCLLVSPSLPFLREVCTRIVEL